MGYTHPTPVQLAVFEPAARGIDLVVQARTGTGKTAAFGLPIIETVVRRNRGQGAGARFSARRASSRCRSAAELERLGQARNIKPVAIYGGAPMGAPGRALARARRSSSARRAGCSITSAAARSTPKHVRMLVLDEADEMLSMGFERELSAILERLPKSRQTLLFSATIPPDIERIARRPAARSRSSSRSRAITSARSRSCTSSTSSRGDKLGALLRMLEVENPESAVVFCNTKDETERVAEALAAPGLRRRVAQRRSRRRASASRSWRATREGKLRFLVATDVAARGIDISHLTHVINYDFPERRRALRAPHRPHRPRRPHRHGDLAHRAARTSAICTCCA